MRGMIFGTLPPQRTVIVLGRSSYYYHDNVFFVRVIYRGRVSYRVIAPPIGAPFSILPVGHRTVIVRGVNYYEFDDVYYVRRGGRYVVVVRP
jgi:hypothetical protein